MLNKKWVEPTPAQAEAGNYFKPEVSWRGLTIKVENPAGTIRRGKGWETKMVYDYGYVSGTEAVDGDEVDVYLGPSLEFAPMVYVVHQRRAGDWKNYDEDKCMLGFLSKDAAGYAYLQHYDDPRFLGPITAMPVDEFVDKVRATKEKPAMIKSEALRQFLAKSHVAGYVRKDGTSVRPHEDKRVQKLADDLQAQEKWLHGHATAMGYRDIDDLAENDYPAFERLAAQWRNEHPVEVALKSILFFKGFVGPYLRDGKIVNLGGYRGRVARATSAPGQLSLFSTSRPLGPSPFKGKDPVASTADLFSDHHPDKLAWAKKVIAERDHMPWQDVKEAHEVLGIKDEAAEWASKQLDAAKRQDVAVTSKKKVRDPWSGNETHVTLSNGKTHRLQRLNTTESMGLPGWHDLDGGFLADTEDDAISALLAKHNKATTPSDVHGHLLADIPGAKWRRGKGLIAGHYGVEIDGEVHGNFHAKPEDAVAAAKQALASRKAAKDEANQRTEAIGKLRERLMSGVHPSDADLKLLGLREASSGLEWFIPAAAEVFGITSRAVRPLIAENIRVGHTDMGAKKEFVTPKHALLTMAAKLAPPKDAPTEADKANPRKKFYVTMLRSGEKRPAFLAGPFDRHEDALDHVGRARDKANEVDPRSAFDAFGTSGLEADQHPPGVLNQHLGIGRQPHQSEDLNPWEETKSEYLARKKESYQRSGYVPLKDGAGISSSFGEKFWSSMHRDRVMEAIDAGKSVPDKVLADYPELSRPDGGAPSPATADDHPAPMPRSLLSSVPENRRDEWKDLHRQQHELHHYELGQVREKMDRLRSKRNKAQASLREAEFAASSLRGAPVPDPAREAEAQKMVDKHHAEFTKLTREHDGLVGQHQSLYEKVAKLGRAKDQIYDGSGDMDRDFASMSKRTAAEQQAHEKSMLKMYREHYKDKDAESKVAARSQPMAKSIVFLRRPKS